MIKVGARYENLISSDVSMYRSIDRYRFDIDISYRKMMIIMMMMMMIIIIIIIIIITAEERRRCS